MSKTNNNLLKIILIISVILNLAFITGFVIQKISTSSSKYYIREHFVPSDFSGSPGEHFPGYDASDERKGYKRNYKLFGLKHLCSKSPGFLEVFKRHSKEHFKIIKEITEYRSQLLEELKKDKPDTDRMDKLLDEINRLNREAEKKNLEHLLSLKKTLEKDVYDSFISRMERMLKTRGIFKPDFFDYDVKKNEKTHKP